MNFAPVLIFCYKRLDTLKQTISALQNNALAKDTEVFIFSDGGKSEEDKKKILEVREYLRNISGFKKVVIKESNVNKGLANSIIKGVTEIIEEYGKVIVLEDDLITASNFLEFMNHALCSYEKKDEIFSISGYTVPITIPKNYPYDNYFTKRGSSWGWGTWKNRWSNVDWEVSDYDHFEKNGKARSQFNKMGSDMSGMLKQQMEGKISSWAIRWTYHQYKHDLFSVFPVVSKIKNIGFGDDATHTVQKFNRFNTVIDKSGKNNFQFHFDVKLEKCFINQFLAKYNIRQRVIYKVLNFFS